MHTNVAISCSIDDLVELVESIDNRVEVSDYREPVNLVGFSPINLTKEKTITWMRLQEIDWTSIKAKVIVCQDGLVHPDGLPILFVYSSDPRLLFAKLMAALLPKRESTLIHPTAVIGRNCSIGNGCYIGAYSVIGDNVTIGDDTEIHQHVTISGSVSIGSRCLIKSGSIIGEEGFGFATAMDGTPIRIPHIGSVVIENDVEIGALNTICSGTLTPTLLESDVKLDDHVHVAHNVIIRRKTLITACVEISGSVEIGERVWIGPNSTVIDNITIGTDAFIGAGANILRSIPANSKVIGLPSKIRKGT